MSNPRVAHNVELDILADLTLELREEKVSYSHICTLVHTPYLYIYSHSILPIYSGFIDRIVIDTRPIKRHCIFLHLCLPLLLPSLPVFSSSLHLCKFVDTAESAHMMELANRMHKLISYLIGQFHRLSALLSFNYVQRAVLSLYLLSPCLLLLLFSLFLLSLSLSLPFPIVVWLKS